MPTWKVHLSAGTICTGLILYGFYLSKFWYVFTGDETIPLLFWVHACFACMLGSLMPDFDYRKTRIRHALGPALGTFVISSYIYLKRNTLEEIEPVFLMVLMITFILVPVIAGLAIPFKHHGKLHSISFAGLYGISWLILGWTIFSMHIIEALIIGVFGFAGYLSHLVLDWDMKFI